MNPSFRASSSSIPFSAASGHPPVRGALYLRLSKDDDAAGESSSISNQRKLLLRYAAEHAFPIVSEYSDDGFSGTTFERPGFQAMIRDVEDGKLNLILTKDLSRLGRDYIKTGQYTELFFPSHGVRFIAVGDGYDSAGANSDLIPFMNVVNEMYARDISRKIRASLQVRMEEGSYIGNFAPYGYQKSEEDRRRLTPDPVSAAIVRRIFEEAADGALPSFIAASLNREQIPPPALYRCAKRPDLKPEHYTRHGKWTANTIVKLLHNPVYLGHMVQGKTRKISFKSRLTIPTAPADRPFVPDTHPPLISRDIFDQCQEELSRRACRGKHRY